MKNILICFVILIIANCSTTRIITKREIPKDEELIECFPAQKPQWTYKEPEIEGDYLYFIGISDKTATEKDARSNALQDSVKKFAGYCGIEVNELYKGLLTSLNISSGITDPTKINKTTEQQKIDSYVSRVKASEWYIEKWALKSGKQVIDYYYRVFVKAKVPKQEYDKVLEYKNKKAELLEQKVSYQYEYEPVAAENWELEAQSKKDNRYYYFSDFKITDKPVTDLVFEYLKENIKSQIYAKLGITPDNDNEVSGIEFDRKYIRTKYKVKGYKLKKRTPVEYKAFMRGKIAISDYKKCFKEIEKLKRLGKYANLPIELQFAFITEDRYGKENILADESKVYSGDEFRIAVRSNQDCYLYIFNIDSSNLIKQIFPVEGRILIGNPIKKGIKYKIPDELVYTFDKITGNEVFYIFAFKEPVNDFTKLKEKINNKQEQNQFLARVNKKYTTRGTTITQSKYSFNLKDKKYFPDLISGEDYIMRVIILEHY